MNIEIKVNILPWNEFKEEYKFPEILPKRREVEFTKQHPEICLDPPVEVCLDPPIEVSLEPISQPSIFPPTETSDL